MIYTRSSFQLFFVLLGWFLLVMVPLACVDPEIILLRGTNDILVVDGMVMDLGEPQIIKINRSKADPLTGRFPPNVPEIQILENSLHARPYTAICESKENQTPAKPVGWRD